MDKLTWYDNDGRIMCRRLREVLESMEGSTDV